MAEIVNDRDVLIMAAVPRYTPPTDRGMFLTPSSAIFRASGDGATSTPPSFTFKATLLNMAGQVSFAASNGAKLTVNAAANEATLDFAAYLAAGAEAVFITAAITVDGTPYTQEAVVTKVSDGAQGADGSLTGMARLYQFSTTVPAKPTGSSTFTWAGAWNGAYTGTDGWSVTVPANPGTPGLRLYVASVSVSAAAKATTTSVSYTGATVEAWSQNGAAGVSGVQSGVATVYQWAATIPSGPTGNALFRWASSAFGEAPTSWALTPGAAPSFGMTLWAASVRLLDTAANGDTAFNWSSASIMAIGYAGTNGGPGQQGASYVTAYIASSATAANGAPAQTTGRTSLPAANSSGLAGAWSATVPSLADGQRMYQSDGIYDPTTDKVTWSIPYWSSLKVATLSAITANLGAITGGSLNIGNGKFTVDAAGNVTMSSFILFDPNTGKAMLQAGGKFSLDFMPTDVKNSEIAIGGRNLAEDSAFERRLRPWSQRSAGVTAIGIEGAAGARNLVLESNSGDAYVDGQGPYIPVVPGQQYMISCEYASAGVISSSSSYFYCNDGSTIYLPLINSANSGGVRTRYSLPWTCPAGVTGISPRFGVRCSAYSWMRVYNFDVQVGNKAAPWSPAKEDIDAGIATAGTTSTWAGTTGAGKPQDNATVGATWGANIGGQPNDISNLVKTSTFDKGVKETWEAEAQTVEAAGGANVGALPYKYQLVTRARDVHERGNNIPVTPGETLHVAAWLSTEATNFKGGFGFEVYDAQGQTITWVAVIGLNPFIGWSYREGSYTFPAKIKNPQGVDKVPAFVVPWIQQDGFDFSTGNWLRATGLWIGRHARGATVGAPSGTMVAGAAAEVVAANAAAVPAMSQAINKKLQKDGYDVITGQIGLQSKYAILVGDTTNGVWIGSEGLVLVQGGVIKVTIPISGNPTFAGQLIAAMGTFGTLRIAPGGSICSGDFTGYVWPRSSQLGRPVTGFYFGEEGFLFGDLDAGRYLQIRKDGNWYAPGFTFENGQLTLNSPVIIAPRLQTSLSVSIPTTQIRNVTGSSITFGVSCTISGGVGGPYRYLWTFSPESGPDPMAMTGSPTNESAAIKATGSGWRYGYISVTVYDSGGAVASASTRISVQFGSSVEP